MLIPVKNIVRSLSHSPQRAEITSSGLLLAGEGSSHISFAIVPRYPKLIGAI